MSYDLNHAKPRLRADSVVGCMRCGKPCALVGDFIPFDGLCPWCRAEDTPRVYRQYLEEAFVSKIMGD